MNDQSPAAIGRASLPRPAVRGVVARLLHRVLDRIDSGMASGAIETLMPDGTRRVLGGRSAGTVAGLHIVRWRALIRLATGGSSGWYVAWDKGEWTSPDPVALFEVLSANRRTLGDGARARGVSRRLRHLLHLAHRNSRAGARRNVAAHYDLGNDFYAAWLDPTLSYSSALFESPGEPLAEAQHRKLAAILARTNTQPGDTLLEIGCGWGSFVAIAAKAGRHVHAITLSAEQQASVAAKALPNVAVTLTDYRDVTQVYDGIASIEMVEAVGQDYWPDYLAVIARALRPGGRAAIQYIVIDDAIFESYAANADFIQRYVFPGGMLLSRARFKALAEMHGLDWRDERAFGADYAETLRRWRLAFDAAVTAGRLPDRFDSKFIRLWRFYLMYCEGGFRGGGIDVAQVTLVKR
ncbi:cyclopropane-fatty-acyl-phospholipid synthase family protein [Sphingomonas sp. 28-63-12]|uniref:SAM-dependent methyltransferase n=1 Tax=Sphingomonas sp. 28-63-12 TaxID=1970434 RepID=UPI000BDC9173|nr:MAG: SAM-dependent methyltransferase [Sphingomonas sp. 28-63-12]